MIYFGSLPRRGRPSADLAQLVEQLFRKQQVAGSSPAVGSRRHLARPGEGEETKVFRAEVAEPADALRSGRSERKLVGVQISPSAPDLLRVPWRGEVAARPMVARRLTGAGRGTFTTEDEGREGGRWPGSGPEESPGCAEQGCPVKAGEAWSSDGGRRRQSRSARGSPRESNRDQGRRSAVRREKGNPPRSNLRFGRLQVARRGRKSRAAAEATERPVPFGGRER